MTRKSKVSKAIYRKHIALYRYINDAWIFADLIEPDLQARAKQLRGSKTNVKRGYKAPKKSGWTVSKRRNQDIGRLFQAQFERGIFELTLFRWFLEQKPLYKIVWQLPPALTPES